MCEFAVFAIFSGVPVATMFSAADAAFGAEVDDPIGGFDHVQIVFDNEQAGAVVDQRAKGGEKFVDVFKVQAGRRFVKDEKSFRIGGLREVRGKFYTLCLAAA